MAKAKAKSGKAMKVWASLLQERFPLEGKERRPQVRTLVRAASKKRAIELLSNVGFGVTASEFNSSWAITGNQAELAAAAEFDEGVWQSMAEGYDPHPQFRNLA